MDPLMQMFFLGVAMGAAPFLITWAILILAHRDEERRRRAADLLKR